MTTTTSALTGTPTTPPPEHPDAQQLAAFLEGRLTGEVKARTIAHLANCTDCAEVFADAAAFQAEEEGWDIEAGDKEGVAEPAEATEKGGQPDNVLRFPGSSRFWMIGTLVAAGLTVLLLQTPALQWLKGTSTPLPPGVQELGELQIDHDWNRTRSGTVTAPAMLNRTVSFRLAVRLVEWEWILRSEGPDLDLDLADIRNLTPTDWTDRGGLWDALKTLATFDEGMRKVESKVDADPALRDAFEFGRWTAWAHLQAHREDPNYLLDHPDFLDRVSSLANQHGAKQHGAPLDEATLDDLRSNSPTPETWQALRDAIRTTLDEGPGDAP